LAGGHFRKIAENSSPIFGRGAGRWVLGLVGATATAVVVGSAYHKAIIEWLRSVSGIE
jgi:hypothetical protein